MEAVMTQTGNRRKNGNQTPLTLIARFSKLNGIEGWQLLLTLL